MGFDKKYLVSALVYAAAGMGLGIYMAASNNHGQFVTHAHVLLIGFVVSVLYAVIHKLWLIERASILAALQFYAHQCGVVVMAAGLYSLYSATVPPALAERALAAASVSVLSGALLMLLLVIKSHYVGAPMPAIAATWPKGC